MFDNRKSVARQLRLMTPTPVMTVREYVNAKLADFTLRQEARNQARAEHNLRIAKAKGKRARRAGA